MTLLACNHPTTERKLARITNTGRKVYREYCQLCAFPVSHEPWRELTGAEIESLQEE